jgi:hypothetical protein
MAFSVAKNMDVNEKNIQEEFEDTKGAIRTRKSEREQNSTIAKRKRINGQTTIHKTYP